MIKKIFLINIIFFLIFIFLCEVLGRTFHLVDLGGVSKNLIIYDKTSDIHTNKPNAEAVAFSKKIFIDKFGFRVPYKDFSYSEKNPSILVMGDSVTFAVGVKEESSFVGLLREKFKDSNFFNTSVPGYHLGHYPNVVEKNKKLTNIKEVILFYTLEDIFFVKKKFSEENKPKLNKNNNKFINKLKGNYLFGKLNSFLRDKSVFYMLIKGIFSKPSERYFYDMRAYYEDENSVKELKVAFEKLQRVTEENNFNLLIIVLPYEFQTRIKHCNSSFLHPQNIVKNIFTDLKIKFNDYTDVFCNEQKPSLLFLKYDPVHLSINGHRFVFDLLSKDLNY